MDRPVGYPPSFTQDAATIPSKDHIGEDRLVGGLCMDLNFYDLFVLRNYFSGSGGRAGSGASNAGSSIRVRRNGTSRDGWLVTRQ